MNCQVTPDLLGAPDVNPLVAGEYERAPLTREDICYLLWNLMVLNNLQSFPPTFFFYLLHIPCVFHQHYFLNFSFPFLVLFPVPLQINQRGTAVRSFSPHLTRSPRYITTLIILPCVKPKFSKPKGNPLWRLQQVPQALNIWRDLGLHKTAAVGYYCRQWFFSS